MRLAFIFLLFVLSCAFLSAGENGPAKSIFVPCTTWFHGFLAMADAVVVGKVTKVTDEISQVDPNSKVYNFSLAVEGVGGSCPELKGVKEIRSENHNIVRAGTWVIMLIHYYEDKPNLATGSRELDVIEGVDDPLAQLFVTKGVAYQDYTDDDMVILKKRMPAEYENILPRREILRNQSGKSEQNGAGNGGSAPARTQPHGPAAPGL